MEYIAPAPGWEVISGGSTARIERQDGSNQVVKLQYPNCSNPKLTGLELEREFEIYRSLPRQARLLHLEPGSTSRRLILPYLGNGTLRDRLKSRVPLLKKQRLQLAADAAEAVQVLHEHHVVHCDIKPSNFMLNNELRLCVIDFSGSRLRDQEGTAIESIRFFSPRMLEDPSTTQTDLFALGSVLYAIFSGQEPYEDKTDDEVTQLFATYTFPPTEELLCGDVISKCWTKSYDSAREVFDAICTISASHL